MNAPDESLVRSTYLGSSDIAAVLGMSKWKSPLEVYINKVEPGVLAQAQETDVDRERRLRRGKLMEPVVRQMAVEDYGLTVIGVNERHTHPEHTFLRAEVDFEIVEHGIPVNCEVKTVHPFSASEWGDEDTEDIPVDYLAQVMFALACTGKDKAYVFALFGSDNLVRYIVHRDDETIEGMIEEAVRFWEVHVLPQVPPPAQTYEDAVMLMDRMKKGVVCPADEITLRALLDLDQARRDERTIKANIEALKTGIAIYAAEQTKVNGIETDRNVTFTDVNGRPIATWNRQRGSHLDQKRLTKDKPDVVLEYTREHWYRVIKMKKGI